MKVKTSDLNGAALDWAVAKIENPEWWEDGYMDGDPLAALDMDDGEAYAPSSTWSQGGPIIEREGISVGDSSHFDDYGSKDPFTSVKGFPEDEGGERLGRGKTYLIAAMRCFVVSKLGDEVEIPDELIKEK